MEKLISRHPIIGFPHWEKLDLARLMKAERGLIYFLGKKSFFKIFELYFIFVLPRFRLISRVITVINQSGKKFFFRKFRDNAISQELDFLDLSFELIAYLPQMKILLLYRRGTNVSLSKLNIFVSWSLGFILLFTIICGLTPQCCSSPNFHYCSFNKNSFCYYFKIWVHRYPIQLLLKWLNSFANFC